MDFSSDCKNENDVVEEDLQDTIDDSNEECIAIDSLDLVPDAHAVLDLNEEILIEEYFSQILQDFSYDVFSPVIEENNQKTACHSLQDT